MLPSADDRIASIRPLSVRLLGCIRISSAALHSKGKMKPKDRLTCHAGKDGECQWKGCPQIKDSEPQHSGRHCPLDTWCSDCEGVGCNECNGTGHIEKET